MTTNRTNDDAPEAHGAGLALAVPTLRPGDADRERVSASHHKLYSVTSADEDGGPDGIEVLCRQPARAEWRRFLDVSFGDKSKAYGAMLTLFSQCLVWPRPKSPERADLDALFERAPQLETMLAGAFVGELHAGFDAAAKKV